MKMKIVTLALVYFTILMGFEAAAQEVHWGVRGGGNMSAMLLKDESGYYKVKLRPGFHIGGFSEISISEKFVLQPALLFTTKGYKHDKDGFSNQLLGVDMVRYTSYYIELPLNIIFKPEVGSGNLLLGAGPYLAYGLGGKWKAVNDGYGTSGTLKFLNNYQSSDSTLGGNTKKIPYTKPLDFGANILIGYEFFNNFFFHFNGQVGLIDVDPSYNGVSDERSFQKTVQFGLSVGYRF